jgi:catechol 2,3-dioxygenase-like lactoylglutathione lyase family enzyme
MRRQQHVRNLWHAALLTFVCAFVVAHLRAADSGPVIGVGNLPHGVANIENAIGFYERTLGLRLVSINPPRVDGKLGPNFYDAKLQALMNVGGAYYRIATFSLPDSPLQLQLVEMINNDPLSALRGRRQTSALATEAGSLLLRLPVADVEALSTRIRNQFAADVLSLAGKPAGSIVKRFAFRDGEDGFVIESVQSSKPQVPGIVLVAANIEKKLQFYRDILGFNLTSGEWESEQDALQAVGAETGMIRRHGGTVPGTSVPFEIEEYRGFHQRRFYSPIMGQAGVGWLQLIVRDVDTLMKTFIERRVRIVSTALQPVDFDDSRRVVVRDPDGVYVELIQPKH